MSLSGTAAAIAWSSCAERDEQRRRRCGRRPTRPARGRRSGSRRRRGAARASGGLISRMAVCMGVQGLQLGATAGRRRGGSSDAARSGRDGRCAPAVRPAADTCSGPCAIAVRGSCGPGRGARSARGRRRRAGAERALHRLERQQRALHARRADLDAEELEDVARRHRRGRIDGLALDLVGQQRGRGLADRAAAPVNPTPSITPPRTRSCIVIRSPHSGFAPSWDVVAPSSCPKLWGRR